jgi:hypothetical protein
MTEKVLPFSIGAYTATATLDVLGSDPTRHRVVDWKISRSPTADNTFQLDSYGLAVALTVADATPGAIDVSEVNLLTGTVRKRTPTRAELDSAENTIRSSAAGTQALDPGKDDLPHFAAGLLVTDTPPTWLGACSEAGRADLGRVPSLPGRRGAGVRLLHG